MAEKNVDEKLTAAFGKQTSPVAEQFKKDHEGARRGRPRKLALQRDDQVTDKQVQAGGRAKALGRDGKVLTRKRTTEGDKYSIDLSIVPDGWTYEWKRKSIFGQEDFDHITGLMENGWTPVPAERHVGQFMVRSATGEIVRDGLILMERPIELTREARDEDRANAKLLIRLQQEQYRARMPSGMDADHPDARVKLRTTYEPGPDGPGHQIITG